MDPDANRERVWDMLIQRKADLVSPAAEEEHVCVIVLPEMTFTGYVFHSVEEVLPVCETGQNPQEPTRQWCAKVAKEFHCFVQCGFPQKVEQPPAEDPLLYNSVMLVDPQGELVFLYSKAFLYTTDEAWAQEGPGFLSLKVPGLGQVGSAICMDINPYRFESPFNRFECATFHRDQGTSLLLFSANWLLSPEEETSVPEMTSKQEREDFLEHLTYWMTRLSPMLGRPALFVASNRVGVERGSLFCGKSMVVDLQSGEVLGHLDYREESILIVEASTPTSTLNPIPPPDLQRI